MTNSKFCFHCSNKLENHQEKFCCLGCLLAYKIIKKNGFFDYYKIREFNQNEVKLKPDDDSFDLSEFVEKKGDNTKSLNLIIRGLQCSACVWLIENILKKQKSVIDARINLVQKTLLLTWIGEVFEGNQLVNIIKRLGYKVLPFDSDNIKISENENDNKIIKALAIAGFGAGNIMLFSVSLWFANSADMGTVTRNFFHFFSSLIALPVVIYSARIFFISAYKALKIGYPNMDLAISIAILLACAVSLLETFRGGEYVYFDSVVMLIFFLLIGRYLEFKVRKKAFNVVAEFTFLSASFGRIEQDKKIKIISAKKLQQDMILLVAVGEKIAGDGVVIEGESEIDSSLITGETLPKKVIKDSEVFAGTINLSSPLKVRITKPSNQNLLSQIINLINKIESKKSHYVRIADRLSRLYTPAVHIIAFLTFLLWFFFYKESWEIALMNATAVLIITCPCALALAIPIVQTISVANLIKKGILVKNGEVFEKLQKINTIVFDKTGSLTLGKLRLWDVFLIEKDELKVIEEEEKNHYLKIASALSKKSKHPISEALAKNNFFDSSSEQLLNLKVKEIGGFGLESELNDIKIRLGRKEFCEVSFDEKKVAKNHSYKFFSSPKCFMKFDQKELVFFFKDQIKEDAKIVVEQLKKMNKKIILLSGDSIGAVKNIAKELEIEEFYYDQTPINKANFLTKLRDQKIKFLMVGDGLNDAPSLAMSDVSMSFSRAVDITQNIADIVIQGEKLMPIISIFYSSKKTIEIMKQNLFLAVFYNIIAVPFAISGHVIPLISALAMSSSSLLVLINSLRIKNFLIKI